MDTLGSIQGRNTAYLMLESNLDDIRFQVLRTLCSLPRTPYSINKCFIGEREASEWVMAR